jgi:hypothetical protein
MAKARKNFCPATFSAFRVFLADAMKKAGCDPVVCYEVGDVGYEGGQIASEVFNCWQEIEEFVSAEYVGKRPADDWKEEVWSSVHDCVINLVCDNAPRGERDEMREVKCIGLAAKVVKEMLGIDIEVR